MKNKIFVSKNDRSKWPARWEFDWSSPWSGRTLSLTGRYFQPCQSRLVVYCHDWEPDKEYVTHGLLLIWKFSMGGWKTAFLPGNTKWHMNCSCLCPVKNAHFKEFWFHNIITYRVHPGKGTCIQPSKLKLLLGHYLATNSFGLGRLFYESSRQLQNFRRHGDQNGPNLEGWYAKIEPKSKRKAKNRKSN